MKHISVRTVISLLLSTFALGACAAEDSAQSPNDAEEDLLTSNTALQRALKFDGLVYVAKGTNDEAATLIIKKQTQTAFGALRTADVGVATRELGNVDARTFRRRTVQVVTPGQTATTELDEIRYTYTDAAVVPKAMARRSSLPLGLLNNSAAKKATILSQCTTGDAHALEFADSSMWYVFQPILAGCQTAMRAEQTAIDAARTALTSPETQVVRAEVERLYVPTVMALGAADTNARPSYPEYDRLFAGTGGAESGKVVISMIQGMQADWAAGQQTTLLNDGAYQETFAQLDSVLTARPGFKLVSAQPTLDFTKLVVGSKTLPITGIEEFIAWEKSGVPAAKLAGTGLTKDQVRMAAAKLIHKHWLNFELPVRVTTAGTARDITVRLNVYFGAEGDATPYRQALKTSDVVTYNGHSYIGYGPLDPKNFAAGDFSPGYQLFFINSCVSYNYYDGGFFPRKAGATKNLDIVSNGLESYQGSANKVGALVARLLKGDQPSFTQLLSAADESSNWGGPQYANYTATDPLRVADGELDNVYKPAAKPITITVR